MQIPDRSAAIPRTLRHLATFLIAALTLGCATRGSSNRLPVAQDQFWNSLRALCGNAYAGRLAQSVPLDTAFAGKPLVMHVRQCTDTEIRIPFHIGNNRSRTWVVTRTGHGLRLKHDHRHADGSEDAITQYGGDSRSAGGRGVQEFHADSLTAALIPAAATNVWTLEVADGVSFAYALRREGTERRFRVEFDLSRTVPAPLAPWGS